MADDRRDFLKMGLAGAMGMTGLPLAASAETGTKVPLTKPVQVHIIDNSEVKDGDRTETRSTFELHGANGSFHRVTSYQMKVDREDAYDTTVVMKTDKFLTRSDKSPADSVVRVVVVSGDKGQVEGDFRMDEVQVTSIGSEGVYRTPLGTVKKSLVDPYAGLSDQDKAQAIVDQRFKNPRE
jgi:hypothetical protein